MKLDELITSLSRVRHVHGNVEVNVAHASTPDPDRVLTRPQTHSALFPLLDVDTSHGVTLVQSNYIHRQTPYIPAVFPDKEPVE